MLLERHNTHICRCLEVDKMNGYNSTRFVIHTIEQVYNTNMRCQPLASEGFINI